MNYLKVTPRTEFDQAVYRAKVRPMPLPSLPWGEAFIGLMGLVLLYMLG